MLKFSTGTVKTATVPLDLDKLAYAIAKFETGNCTIGNSAERNNCFGIMTWKSGNMQFKAYNSPEDSYKDFKRIWGQYYKTFPNKRLAEKWTGKDRADHWLQGVTQFYNEQI